MIKVRFITIILTSAILAAAGGYWFGKSNLISQSGEALQREILLEYRPIVTDGVSKEEAEQIEAFVDKFEGYKFQKDPDKLLAMFTPPDTPKEQDALNSMLGKDYAQGSAKPLSRLFSTQGFNHSVGGHYVRRIKKEDKSVIVTVDELRIFYIGLSEDFVGYSAKVVNLTLEIEESDAGYRISKYYHSSNDHRPKYGGFQAY